MKKYKKQNSIFELTIIACILIITLFFWNSIFLFPIKFFTVLIHEISHGIAAIISGGRVIELQIDFDLGGKCIVEGGSQFLIAFSGYSGSIIIGSIIFYSTYNNFKTFSVFLLCIIISLFAINSINNQLISFTTILFCLALFIITKIRNEFISNLILRLIGLISCLYVIYDIKEDILSSNTYLSDADIIAEISGLSPTLWGIIWLIISLTMIIIALKYAIKK